MLHNKINYVEFRNTHNYLLGMVLCVQKLNVGMVPPIQQPSTSNKLPQMSPASQPTNMAYQPKMPD